MTGRGRERGVSREIQGQMRGTERDRFVAIERYRDK